MSGLDKEKFGSFVSALRREKGLTQKELAEKLFLSDKAISKWERGVSLPGIESLEPLAEILGVTVTELLRGERIGTERLETAEVERLVTAAAHLAEPETGKRRQWQLRWVLSLVGSGGAVAGIAAMGVPWEAICDYVLVVEVLCLIFGVWACFLIREVLPEYYDRVKISIYDQGPFRMNVPGVFFNNRNWPHILLVLRCWMTVTPVLFPCVYGMMWLAAPALCGTLWFLIPTLAACLGFFVPTMIVGKKYQ